MDKMKKEDEAAEAAKEEREAAMKGPPNAVVDKVKNIEEAAGE